MQLPAAVYHGQSYPERLWHTRYNNEWIHTAEAGLAIAFVGLIAWIAYPLLERLWRWVRLG